MDFKALLNTSEYEFLQTNLRLGSRIMLLGVSGSYGYGTNREGSDIDFRGVTLNLPSDLIGLTSFDQYEDPNTDTVIYSFNKLINLLLNCNPNTIEILGLDEDQYVIKTAVGQELLDHSQLFLSKRAAASFGHYADAQLRSIRNGDYMRGNVLTPTFYEIVTDYEQRFHEAEARSILPDNPDMKAVGAFVENINRRVVTGEIG